ncbi:hypothetical protein DTO166G4_6505 [Paecilomyces variotii]|nr:hypothetical protein DTO166G4_6505 [Paecilomyces variotii]KAJ9225251.1 hypothetical protein DTO169C6_2281 [Paecilomyces variotii]KAJ9230393.1 hypothetical protein DTO166G5_7358 [Paecilomyces variotii]KAJ9247015.1 hypothetical protein DTO207G8_8400 [Paecilomyces variotii]KAJ9298750.1 hypothetical protein DTO217A2_8381 [Paecilomyces variotii]
MLPAETTTLAPVLAPSKSASTTEPPVKNATLPPFIVPPGWTTNPRSPGYKADWADYNSEGQVFARCHGLAPARPIMEHMDSLMVIFQSGDKFYLWERVSDVLAEIISQDLYDITTVIAERGLRDLRREVIPCLFDPTELADQS